MGIVFGFCLIVVSMFGSVRLLALNPLFFHSLYDHMELADTLHVSDTELDQTIDVLLDYILDKRSTIDTKITISGVEQTAFNEKEARHMVDVKSLYQNFFKVSMICFVLMIVLIVFFFKSSIVLFRGIWIASLITSIGLIGLGIWMAIDFTSFWLFFHTIFFDNDLFLLDPYTDFMINMLPEFVFSTLVGSIISLFVLIMAIFNGISIRKERQWKKSYLQVNHHDERNY